MCRMYARYLYGTIRAGYFGNTTSPDITFDPANPDVSPYTMIDTISTTAFCRLVASSGKTPDQLFGIFRCDPSKPCCPGYGITTRTSTCPYTTYGPNSEGSCAPDVSCAMVDDACPANTDSTMCESNGCSWQIKPYFVDNGLYPRMEVSAGQFAYW